MEIFGVEFESWNIVLLRLNWFAILLLIAVVGIIAWIYSIVSKHINRKSITIDEISLGIGNSSVKLTYNKKDQEIAYKLWVELSTRKIGLMFEKEHDVITEVYNSWYEFFNIARELLKDIPASRLSYSNELIELTEKVLNTGLRPHLTTWQAKYRKWYEKELLNNNEDTPQELQRKYPHYEELVDDLLKTNMRMLEYKNLMKKIAFPKK
jgi:hypothetical protein